MKLPAKLSTAVPGTIERFLRITSQCKVGIYPMKLNS